MKFNFSWLKDFSKTDSQARALIKHFREMKIKCDPNDNMRTLIKVLKDQSDLPYFWLSILESAWRVFVYRSECLKNTSYSPNFKRSSAWHTYLHKKIEPQKRPKECEIRPFAKT